MVPSNPTWGGGVGRGISLGLEPPTPSPFVHTLHGPMALHTLDASTAAQPCYKRRLISFEPNQETSRSRFQHHFISEHNNNPHCKSTQFFQRLCVA